MGSSSIFNIALGPRHDRMMSATLVAGQLIVFTESNCTHVFAAVIFDICACFPICLSPAPVSASVSLLVLWVEWCQRTHYNHRSLHPGCRWALLPGVFQYVRVLLRYLRSIRIVDQVFSTKARLWRWFNVVDAGKTIGRVEHRNSSIKFLPRSMICQDFGFASRLLGCLLAT